MVMVYVFLTIFVIVSFIILLLCHVSITKTLQPDFLFKMQTQMSFSLVLFKQEKTQLNMSGFFYTERTIFPSQPLLSK